MEFLALLALVPLVVGLWILMGIMIYLLWQEIKPR